MRNLLIIFLSLILTSTIQAQDECKVLMEDLQGTYVGKCRNGLAHGNGKASGKDFYSGKFKYGYPEGRGTYTYASGAKFTGEFMQGKRHGKGIYEYKVDGKKVAQEGFWEDDVYVGPKKIKPYKVIRSTNIDKYTLYNSGDGNDVRLEFLQVGRTNSTIQDLIIYGSSGSEQQVTSFVSWKNVEFPFRGNVRYTTLNKLKTTRLDAYFEFEIIKPGSWQVKVFN